MERLKRGFDPQRPGVDPEFYHCASCLRQTESYYILQTSVILFTDAYNTGKYQLELCKRILGPEKTPSLLVLVTLL